MNNITTKRIAELLELVNNGKSIPRSEHFYYNGDKRTLNSSYYVALNNHELNEYAESFSDIFKFIDYYNQYSTKKFLFRRYQQKILTELNNGYHTIHHSARQLGFNNIFKFKILHDVLFHGKRIILNNEGGGLSLYNDCIDLYYNLPYHFKKGIISKDKTCVKFNNGGFISLYDKKLIEDATHIIFNDPIKQKTNQLLLDLIREDQDTNYKIHIKTSTSKPKWIKELIDYAQYNTYYSKYSETIFEYFRYSWQLQPIGNKPKWALNMIKLLGSVEKFEDEYNLGLKIDIEILYKLL